MAWIVALLRTTVAVIVSAFGTGATITLLATVFHTPFKYDPPPTLTSLEPMSLIQEKDRLVYSVPGSCVTVRSVDRAGSKHDGHGQPLDGASLSSLCGGEDSGCP